MIREIRLTKVLCVFDAFGEARREQLVVNAPTDIFAARSTALTPPAVLDIVRTRHAEAVVPAVFWLRTAIAMRVCNTTV